jgi:Flp pilus assembly protein TadG
MNPSRKNRRNRLGQSLVEFTFVGIPLIFVLISIFEVSRGMWMYHTLAYSVKVGVRFASVHGINCVNTPDNPNNCTVNIGPPNTSGTILYVIRQAAVGLDPTKTTLTFNANGATTTCTLDVGSCSGTLWPPNGANSVGQPIRIDITTPFNSAIAMFWPGAKAVRFSGGTLGASSQDYIQF